MPGGLIKARYILLIIYFIKIISRGSGGIWSTEKVEKTGFPIPASAE